MDRVVIVTKPTRLEELVLQHLTEGAARFVLESRGQLIGPYQEEDAAYKAALSQVRRQIPNDLPVTRVCREDLPHFLFRDKDLIVVCGPDGLFVNLAKYVGDQPILSVNPDPKTVAGALMLFPPNSVGGAIALVQEGKHRIERLPFVKALLDEERVVWGINDIFIGRKDHISARYELSFGNQHEHQSSSGIIVSTGVGSTGWIRSVAAMVSGLSRESLPNKLSSLPGAASNELVFVIREPFPGPSTGTSLVTGRVVPGKPLVVNSEMPDGGYIFSDGVVEQAVAWNAGSSVVVSVGDRYVQRIVR
ncbi:MAG: NAD+ kinase [Planctomycetota bacterium]|nr:NAD+ kinase [Planctomycetota bacterium]